MMQAVMRNEVSGGEAKKRKLGDGRSAPALLVSAQSGGARRSKTELELDSANFVIPKRAKFDNEKVKSDVRGNAESSRGNAESSRGNAESSRGNAESRGATSSRPVRTATVIPSSSKLPRSTSGLPTRTLALPPSYVSALTRPDPGRVPHRGPSRAGEPPPSSLRPTSSLKSKILPRPPTNILTAAARPPPTAKAPLPRPNINKLKVVVPAEQENLRPKFTRHNQPTSKPKVTHLPPNLSKSHQPLRPPRPTGLNRLVAQPPLRMPIIRPPPASLVTPPKRPIRPLYPKSLPLHRPPIGARPHPVRRPQLSSYDPFGLDVMTEEDLDFIDDDETESDDWKRELRSITKYDPSAFSGQDEEALESSQFKLDREEQISEMIAKKEDKDELRKILVRFWVAFGWAL